MVRIIQIIRKYFTSLDNGMACMWGQGKFGQLSLGDTCQDVKVPTQLSASLFHDKKILKIACGARHTIFLTGNQQTFFGSISLLTIY